MTSSKKKEYHTSAEQILKERPPAPHDVKQVILRKANAYMILNRNSGVALCTSCENELDLYSMDPWGESLDENFTDYFPYKHNAKGTCPCCDRDVTVKSIGMGRKSLNERHRILIPAQKGKTTYISLTEVIIDFTGYYPELYKWDSAIYKINDRECTYYKHHPAGFWDSERWERRAAFKLPPDPSVGYYGYRRDDWFTYGYIPKDKEKLFKCDRLKFFDIWGFIEYTGSGLEEFIGIIGQVWKYPAMEMLWKAGFTKIVTERSAGRTQNASINVRGNTLPKIFRSDMQTVRDLKGMNPSMFEVMRYIEALKKYNFRPKTEKEISIFGSLQYEYENGPKFDLAKAVRYIAEKDIRVYDWKDYLKECIKLKRKLKAKTLFPKNFAEEHRKASELVKYEEDQELREKMAAIIAKKKEENGITELNGLMFILAETPAELNLEGKAQHHCVAQYAEKVANGKCFIYFVRRAEEPEKSYYTLELSPNGDIIQCRGLKNCNMTDEVSETVALFSLIERDKIKERKSA